MNDAYKKTIDKIYEEFDTNKNGLTIKKIKRLYKLNGKNELIEKNQKTKTQIFLDQFKNVMIILLLVVLTKSVPTRFSSNWHLYKTK